MSAHRGNEKMDVVIFAALPFVTDKESRAPIGCAAQIRPIRPWWSAEKGKLAANILFHRPGGTWRRSTPSPPTLNLIYRPKRSSRDFGILPALLGWILSSSPKCGSAAALWPPTPATLRCAPRALRVGLLASLADEARFLNRCCAPSAHVF